MIWIRFIKQLSITEGIVGGGWRVNNEWVQSEQHVKKNQKGSRLVSRAFAQLEVEQLYLTALRQWFLLQTSLLYMFTEVVDTSLKILRKIFWKGETSQILIYKDILESFFTESGRMITASCLRLHPKNKWFERSHLTEKWLIHGGLIL